MGGRGGGGSSRVAEQQRQDELERQRRIATGQQSIDQTFQQFDDPFFQQQADSFVAYARPQIDRQYDQALEALNFALARRGQTDSSSRAEAQADLARQRADAERDINDQARGFANQSRNAVENARSDLLSILQGTGDAEAASNAAISRAAALTQQPTYSPIGQLFTDTSSLLSGQLAAERAAAAGLGRQPRYSTGLYEPANSTVVTN